MRTRTNNQVSWEAIQQALKENFWIFGIKVKLTEKQEARLKATYNESLQHQKN